VASFFSRSGWNRPTPNFSGPVAAVVVGEGDVQLAGPDALAQIRNISRRIGQLLGVAGRKGGQRRDATVPEPEVVAVPVEDLRQLQPPALRVEAVARAIAHEAQGLLIHLGVEARRHEGLFAQRRTADAGAVDGEMHPRIVIVAALAQHRVLDVVERDLAAEQRHPLRLPGAAEDTAQVLDRLQVGVAREDQLQREGVVGIDQEGLALGPGPAGKGSGRHSRQAVEVSLQGCTVGAAIGQKPGVGHLRGLTAAHDAHVLAQQAGEGRMAVVKARRLRPRGSKGGHRGDRRDKGPAQPGTTVRLLHAHSHAD
jgi:hypothetical protein